MHKKLYLIVLACSFFFTANTRAQTSPKPQTLIPPPPNVSALGKFGLIPVSNFSGIPSIAYPVYTIQEGNLSFPISLLYHAGGIKVKEDASEIGLGWALSASGSIVSTVRGAPDFEGGFANTYVDMPDNPDQILSSKSPLSSIDNFYYLWNNNQNQFTANGVSGTVYSGLSLPHNGVSKEYFNYFQVGYNGNGPDFASDLYTVSIGDRSYKFIFDNNFKPIVLGDGALKIELIPNGTYPDWKITDEKGIIYFFTQRQLNSTNSSDPYFVENRVSLTLNTWHLTKIVSPVNGEINFDYLYSTQNFTHPLPNIGETYLVGNPSPHTQQNRDNVTASYSIYQQLNIDKIRFSDGFVKFIYAETRADLQGARRLQDIEIRNKKGSLVRRVTLDNDAYFTATAGFSGNTAFSAIFNNLSQYTSDNHYKRLKLKGISETDSLGLIKFKQTLYTYNETLNLPAKLSLSVDHWGHYNGTGNGQLVPPANIYLNGAWQSIPGANRDANPDYMQANILTSIQHPTGGTTTFSYETNNYIRNEPVTTYRDTVSNGYKAPGATAVSYSGFMDANGNFVAQPNWGAPRKMNIFCLVDRHGTYPADYFLNILVYKDGDFLKRIATSASSYTPIIDSSIVVTSGSTYRVYFEPYNQTFFNNCEIRLQVYFKEVSSTTVYVDKTHYSGGLRVSKITNYDPATQTSNIKKFTYIDGREDDMPIYVSQQGTDNYLQSSGPPVVDVANNFRYLYGQSIYPFCDSRDAACFGYSKVQVSESDSNNLNGISEFNYNASSNFNVNTMLYYGNTLSSPGIVNPIMATVPSVPGGRGDLIEEKHYKTSGSNLVPVSSDYYYYDRDNPQKIWQMLFNSGLSDYTSPGFDNGQIFRIYAHQFPIPVYRNIVNRKEHFEYDVAGNQTLSTYENYTYDKTQGHFQLIKKATGTSRNDTLSTFYRYPQDYQDLTNATGLDSAAAGIKLLQQKHIIVPVESYTERKTTTASDPKKYFGGLLNLFNPDQPTVKEVQVLESSTPLNSFAFSSIAGSTFSKNSVYATRLRMKYDALGRLQQQYPEKGSSAAFLWGSSLSYPLAKVENASPGEIAFTSFEADGDPGWSVGSVLRDNTTALTGKNSYVLSNGSISKSGLTAANTYVVSYWTKSPAALTITGTITGYPIKGTTINGWTYYEHQLTGQTTLTVSGTGNIDELRLYPKEAQMTTYTYSPLIGVTSSTDAKGLTTYYEYDGLGRLQNIKDQNGNIVKNYDYHYGAQ